MELTEHEVTLSCRWWSGRQGCCWWVICQLLVITWKFYLCRVWCFSCVRTTVHEPGTLPWSAGTTDGRGLLSRSDPHWPGYICGAPQLPSISYPDTLAKNSSVHDSKIPMHTHASTWVYANTEPHTDTQAPDHTQAHTSTHVHRQLFRL